ncbi:MAG: helix-turn-helix domain-containing protein [Sulfurimonas sp.]|uniref:helix-turn-helix domain-containing protein n=1 Tax=Sulfurimonas sp. TaxID=2022749 RepID=UPI0028CF179A|nr:helix-turn-helix domain-containing protein [Sulfurimonas sp.]MDT8338480.1 helix-turn-helix domain-containing protein [Sulfurimonas sp.]
MHKIANQEDIDTLYRTIGANVMRIRKEKGITQLDLALAIGLKSVGLISVAEIYHNKKHFNLEHLYKISLALNVVMKDFFNGVDYNVSKEEMEE